MARKSESYELMVEKLRSIIVKMEEGTLTLEDSMKLYEEGVKITNKLYKLLKESEEKIKILQEESSEDVLK